MAEANPDNLYDIGTGEKVSVREFSIFEQYREINLDAEQVLRFVNADLPTAATRAKRLAPLIEHLRSVMDDAEVGPWLTWRQQFLRDRSVLEIAHTTAGLDYLEIIVPVVEGDPPGAEVIAFR